MIHVWLKRRVARCCGALAAMALDGGCAAATATDAARAGPGGVATATVRLPRASPPTLLVASAGLALGALLAGPRASWLGLALSVALQGAALAWLWRAEEECLRGRCFSGELPNRWAFLLLHWKVHLACATLLSAHGVQGLWVLLRSWLVPAAAAVATAAALRASQGDAGDGATQHADSAAPQPASASPPPWAPHGKSRSAPGADAVMADAVADAVADVLGLQSGAVARDAPLMDLGLDSAGALRLRAALARRFQTELPASLVFDHPTVNLLASRGLAGGPDARGARDAAPGALGGDPPQRLAALSAACDVPGACALKDLWDALEAGADAVTEVPLLRWDHAEYYAPEPAAGRTYARHGGFVEGADLFDAAFFGVGPAEAQATDPQQRLLLTTAHQALVAGGHMRQAK